MAPKQTPVAKSHELFRDTTVVEEGKHNGKAVMFGIFDAYVPVIAMSPSGRSIQVYDMYDMYEMYDMYDMYEMWLISLTHIALESDLSTSSPANAGRRQDHRCGPAGETKCTAVLGLEQLGELGLPWSTPVLSRLEDSKSLT